MQWTKRLIQTVHFVKNKELRDLCSTDFMQDLVHFLNARPALWSCSIHYVQDQIGLCHLLQGRFKCLNQGVREIPDKPYGVRDNRSTDDRNIDLTQCRIQGCKKLIRCIHLTLCQLIKQRRFSRVGVPSKGDRRGF